MAAQKGRRVSPVIVAKARQVLEFAQQRAARAKNSHELSNAIFAPDGKATELFETESERSAFCRTGEYKRILSLIDALPQPPVNGIVEIVISAKDGEQSRPADKKKYK
jgi:hypothetical protein